MNENDEQALKMALATSRLSNSDAPRIVRIKNTKELETIWVSKPYQALIKASSNLEVIGEAKTVGFSKNGSLFFE